MLNTAGVVCIFLILILGAILCGIGIAQGNVLAMATGVTDIGIAVVASVVLNNLKQKEASNG